MHTLTVEQNPRKPSRLEIPKTKLRNWRGTPAPQRQSTAPQDPQDPQDPNVTLETYVHRVKGDLWRGDHRPESTNKILRFVNFSDNKTKPLASYTEADIRNT